MGARKAREVYIAILMCLAACVASHEHQGINLGIIKALNQCLEERRIHHLELRRVLQTRGITSVSKPFSEFTAIDRVVHEPARLALLTALSARESADFLYLQRLTGLSKWTGENMRTSFHRQCMGGIGVEGR